EMALRLAAALAPFWLMRGPWQEGRHWLETALSRGSRAPPELRARALDGLAHHVGLVEDLAARRAYAAEGLAAAPASKDPWLIARLLFQLGMATREGRDFRVAAALGEESLSLAREAGDPWLIGQATLLLGMVAREERHYNEALALLNESLLSVRAAG